MPHPRLPLTPAGKSRFATAPPRPSPHPHPHPLPDAGDDRVHLPDAMDRVPPPPPRPLAHHSARVRVIARVRPFLPAEIQRHGSLASCISLPDRDTDGAAIHIRNPNARREGYYKVDACYDEREATDAIFSKEVEEAILPALFHGQNATIFVYGATGSGKTYTIQGKDDHPGLMHRSMVKIMSMAEEKNFRVQVSYYQVYLERCYDLLADKCTEVTVLESSDGKTQLRGLSKVHVRSVLEFRELFAKGCLRRKAGHTGLNDVSSRSHGVLFVSIENVESSTVIGKLNLIDLAGNEDNRKTGNDGIRLMESSSINQSLFALSNVINALNSNEPRVPYRDSKLTRILQDSLGGNTYVILIACLNPWSYPEAAHTLSLVKRLRQIPSQNAEKKDPQDEFVMEGKSHSSCDLKGKIFKSVVPRTVVKGKPLFHTPSHHQINRMRRMTRDVPTATSKLRRQGIMHQPNLSYQKGNVAQPSSKEVKQEDMTDKETPPQFLNISSSSENQKNCDVNFNTESVEERSVEEEDSSSDSTNSIAYKENDLHRYSLTPNVKVPVQLLSSSPPLSERLHSLRAAMRDVLHPIHHNSPLESLSSAIEMDCQYPQKLSQEASATEGSDPCKSSQGTMVIMRQWLSESQQETAAMERQTPLKLSSDCAREVGEEKDTRIATPLEKLHHKSSGIKNTIAREYIAFLNTASREELLQMKGIGEKRASYILSLREHSTEPIKEIEDLEKIGISKKQAMSLFENTARHILFS